MRVSSGCIRLRSDDIESLFSQISRGTRVQVINQPVKYAVEPDGKRYIEVHQPLSVSAGDDPRTQSVPLTPDIERFINEEGSDQQMITEALRNARAGKHRCV